MLKSLIIQEKNGLQEIIPIKNDKSYRILCRTFRYVIANKLQVFIAVADLLLLFIKIIEMEKGSNWNAKRKKNPTKESSGKVFSFSCQDYYL